MRKRILSLLLSMVMIFSILPTSVFADVTNTESGKGDGNNLPPADNFAIGQANNYGMRFSLYFVEGSGKWSSYDEYLQAEQDPIQLQEIIDDTINIGKLEVYQRGIVHAAEKWSDTTIFERMSRDGMSQHTSSYLKDYQSKVIPITDIPFNKAYTQKAFESTGIEKILLGDKETAQGDRWVKFFSNLSKVETQEDVDNADFYNVAAVVYKMYEQSGFISLNGTYYPTDKDAFIKLFSEDFKQGIYVDVTGKKEQGVYKFYFEPTTLLKFDKYYAMTLRDMIAYQNAITELDPTYNWNGFGSLSSIGRGGSLTLGNSTYLSKPEPVIHMQGNTLGRPYTNSDVYSNGVDGFGADKPFYQGAGVGVITGAPRGPIAPEVKVVTSYIKITGYNEKGEAIYVETEKAEDTKVE